MARAFHAEGMRIVTADLHDPPSGVLPDDDLLMLRVDVTDPGHPRRCRRRDRSLRRVRRGVPNAGLGGGGGASPIPIATAGTG